MVNGIILQSLTQEQLVSLLREAVREELAVLQSSKQEACYLTRKEVAKLLQISLPTLNDYTKRGIIKGRRVGTRVLYAEADLELAVKDIPNQKYRRGM